MEGTKELMKPKKILEEDNMILRKLLWLRHGCRISHLYGDDGEMQCSECLIDFKRDSAERIEERFTEIANENLRIELEKPNSPLKKILNKDVSMGR